MTSTKTAPKKVPAKPAPSLEILTLLEQRQGIAAANLGDLLKRQLNNFDNFFGFNDLFHD